MLYLIIKLRQRSAAAAAVDGGGGVSGGGLKEVEVVDSSFRWLLAGYRWEILKISYLIIYYEEKPKQQQQQ